MLLQMLAWSPLRHVRRVNSFVVQQLLGVALLTEPLEVLWAVLHVVMHRSNPGRQLS